MKSIFTLIQDIEKLIFKVVLWIVLIPKTLVAIVLHPTGMAQYVKSELNEGESRFDEHMSPVILLLIVALIPAVAALYLLPTFGATITSPSQENPTAERYLFFESQTAVKSTRSDAEYRHTWSVIKAGAKGESGATLHTESHLTPKEEAGQDNASAKDNFRYNFEEGGEYYVTVAVESVNPSNKKLPALESYYASLLVVIPVKLDEPVSIPNTSTTTLGIASDDSGTKSAASTSSSSSDARTIDSLTSQIQKEKTIFLALALMLPPLLFALAEKLFMGESIGEMNLKENFYIQCYFFAPLSLAIWSTYLSRYFFTSDAYFYVKENTALQILLLPLILTGLWFIRTEVKSIQFVRQTTTARAIIIVLVCVIILGFAGNLFAFFSDYQNGMRLFAIQAYPVVAVLFIFGFAYAWYGRRRERGEALNFKSILWTAASFAAIYAVLVFATPLLLSAPIPVSATEAPPATASEADSTPGADVTPVATPSEVAVAETPVPTADTSFVEEFNAPSDEWIDFMTSGDPRMVEFSVDQGALSVQLFKREDRVPKWYYIHDTFTYHDVAVNAVVTNRGNNGNGVGLICRYSNIGWYEAQFSNSQEWSLYAVDNVGVVSQGYNEIAKGTSKDIQSGPSTNEYKLVCKGNEISLFANNVLLQTYPEDRYAFAEGKVGVSVWSPKKLPILVNIETVTVNEQ